MSQAFNADGFIQKEVARLIDKWAVDVAVETGTETGETTQYLATLCSRVYTIELIRTNEYRNSNPCINALYGESPEILSSLAEVLLQYDHIFFYLDAHNQPTNSTPLLEELQVIAEHWPGKAIIAIHDFKVPNRWPYLGCDTYNGLQYDFEFVKSDLAKIYPSGFDYHYNNEAEGAKRGIMFIEPRLMMLAPA